MRNRSELQYKWYYSLVLLIPIMTMSFLIVYRFTVAPLPDAWFTGADYMAHVGVAENFLNGNYVNMRELAYSHIYSYPLFHIFTALLGLVTGDLMWAALIVTMLALLATVFAVRKLARQQLEDGTAMQYYAVDFFAVTSIAVSGIAGVVTNGLYYIPYGSYNIWHNPTYIFMRPFALMSVFYFLELYKTLSWDDAGIEDKKKLRNSAVFFTAFLVLSALAKPSFALLFLIGAGLVTAVMVLKHILPQRKQAVRNGLILLICVAPTIAVMLLQKKYCDSFSVVSFALQRRAFHDIFSVGTLRGVASLYLAPMLFLIVGRKFFKTETLCQIALIMLFVASVIWYGTVQGIEQFTDYAWSYYVALYLAMIVSAIFSVKYMKNRIYWMAYGALWLANLYYGIDYMRLIIETGGYYLR